MAPDTSHHTPSNSGTHQDVPAAGTLLKKDTVSPARNAAAFARLWAGALRLLAFTRLRSLTVRVLAVNMVAVLMLAMGLLYLDRYRQNLIETQLDSLAVQGGIFAAALGEAAVVSNPAVGRDTLTAFARPMVRRLAVPARLRAHLFAANGDLIADSQYVGMVRGGVEVTPLLPPRQRGIVTELLDAYDWVIGRFSSGPEYPPYVDHSVPLARHYPEAQKALTGERASSVHQAAEGGLILSVALPVQRYKQVLGVLMVSVGDAEINEALRNVRVEILSVLGGMLVLIVALSLWLAGTIARPVRRLAAAAAEVRAGRGMNVEIPDLTGRGDEIGDLSGALRDMTAALWARMGAIEGFAADVAHEIKNPLTSLRSAVETASKIVDPVKQRRLMSIILDDVQRLDRLISDISDASRLDAELGRTRMRRVDLTGLLSILLEVEVAAAESRGPSAPKIILDLPEDGPIGVRGIEDKLVQVLRNLIANAASFSPPGGTILIAARRKGAQVTVTIEDQGPGLPDGKFEAIFDRFYSERPASEKFGTHSGLGLSISKQIIDAHRGRIWAENIIADGRVAGARFTVVLMAARRRG
ncbi:MAG: two-component system sensor histidine kinase ChvG [Alphaproteobacteria bacterium]|jgi:two-component system sensor histidine kinase ChvG